jgi:putative phage-type endonuclease
MNELEQAIANKGTGILIGHFANQSPEWHAARAGIGGSDIGTIMGVNRYKTRQQLLDERINGTEPFKPNLAMRMGTHFEAGIKTIWAEDNATWLSVHETGTWQSAVNPFWKANPDGIIQWATGEMGILEIKYSMTTTMPQTWAYQVQWYLMILGLDRGIIVQCQAQKLIEHVIDADEKLQAQMREAADTFEIETRFRNGE